MREMTSVVGRLMSGMAAAEGWKKAPVIEMNVHSASGGRGSYFPPPADFKRLIQRERGSGDAEFVTMSAQTFNKLLEAAMAGLPFDEQAYLERFPDVKAAVKAGKIKSGFRHFVRNGYFERRAAFKFPVDEKWYAETYKDVADAITAGAFRNGSHHFETSGYFEGRAPSREALAEFGEWVNLVKRFPAPE
jgi:hypothetical protein